MGIVDRIRSEIEHEVINSGRMGLEEVNIKIPVTEEQRQEFLQSLDNTEFNTPHYNWSFEKDEVENLYLTYTELITTEDLYAYMSDIECKYEETDLYWGNEEAYNMSDISKVRYLYSESGQAYTYLDKIIYSTEFSEGLGELYKIDEKELSILTIEQNSENITIDGYKGTWIVLESREVDGKTLLWLSSNEANPDYDTFIPEYNPIIVDKDKNIMSDNAPNGFEEYLYFKNQFNSIIEQELNNVELLNQPEIGMEM